MKSEVTQLRPHRHINFIYHTAAAVVIGNEISIMYRAWETVTSSYNRMLRSTNINNNGGMSGGPMYIYSSKYGYQAIAFTRGETSSYNSYVRIDDWIFNKFKSYINLTA